MVMERIHHPVYGCRGLARRLFYANHFQGTSPVRFIVKLRHDYITTTVQELQLDDGMHGADVSTNLCTHRHV